MKRDWPAIFPELLSPGRSVMDPDMARLLDGATEVRLPPRATVFHQGDPCSNYLLVSSSRAVSRTSRVPRRPRDRALPARAGRLLRAHHVLLVRQQSLSGGRHHRNRRRRAGDTGRPLQAAIQQSGAFRGFVFASFGGHLGSLITLVEAVAFGRVDMRLARHLLDDADDTGTVQATHQELATELGSAREAISRQLKDFEPRGLVRLQRGSITLLDRDRLAAVSSS